MTNSYPLFRKIAFAEGISFLALLLIAMPLKYLAGMPKAVTVVGGLHGILFIAFMVMIAEVMRTHKKNFSWGAKAFIASIIPFGTFYMDKFWKKEETAVSSLS